MFADGTASIEVNNKKESIQIQLKNSQTGQLTSQKTVEFKSDTEEPGLEPFPSKRRIEAF